MALLSEKRAGDREKMAKAIAELVVECGATFEREDYPERREIYLRVTAPGGLQVLVDFDGRSPQMDVHVLSWHMAFDSTKRLNDATFGGNVNPHHNRKATYIAHGFDELCAKLKSGLLMAKNGTAYLPEAVPA
jgi:hypothetical protein